MKIDSLIWNTLFYSAISIVVLALIIFSIILFKIHKIRKGIKKDKLNILTLNSVIEGHKKVMEREDFGEPIFELRDLIQNPLDDEIVEFTINTIIKNNFKKILMLGHKTAYEIISISNKTNAHIDILSSEFDEKNYNKINKEIFFSHNLNILDQINQDDRYELILLLSSKENYLFIYEQYIKNLKEKGMFLIANVDKNKAWKKEIIRKINKNNVKYDILKWYKGFILIVK